MKKALPFFFVLLFIFGCTGTAQEKLNSDLKEIKFKGYSKDIEKDYSHLYKQFNVKGSFVLYDMKNGHFMRYNSERCKERFIPASTFKIPNSLIGLETGVIKDENFVIPWDSVVRSIESWNRDQTLASAIKYSAVWYYQELARRVGKEKMQYYINECKYGNMDISENVDDFWLRGNIRISQNEQIEFLNKMYNYKLPFSKRNIDIVKKIILQESTDSYRLFAKTGWAIVPYVGWYVGYVEVNGNVYFFANNIEGEEDNTDFPKSRIEITRSILDSEGIIP